jgi:hypothetical protein
MKLAEANYDNSVTGCCAGADREKWDRREFVWEEKPFLKDHIRAFLHIPLNYGAVISRDNEAIETAEAYPEEPIWLTDEVSPWGSDIYVAVDRDVPNQEIVEISGKFLTRYFEGPYKNIGDWIKETKAYAREEGYEPEKLYFYYATCPKCAKKLGANQVVAFAKVE